MEAFGIDEFTPVWEVSEREFKERLRNEARERGNIFLAGFPPVGNAVPFKLKENLGDAMKVMSFYSYNFPPIAELQDDFFDIPHDELWFSEEKHLFLYIGKYPEVEYIPKATYKQAEILAKIAKELFVSELYTLGVIVLLPEERERMKDVEAFVARFRSGQDECEHSLEAEGVKVMTRREMGSYTILRKAGLLPGIASKLGVESFAVLGVGRRPNDLRACIRAFKAFVKLSRIEIDVRKIEEELERDANALEERIRKQGRRMPPPPVPPQPPSQPPTFRRPESSPIYL